MPRPSAGAFPRRATRGAPALSLALLLAPSAAVTAGTPPPVDPAAATMEEILVTAPEPRYVAPTTRDSIGRIWAPVLIDGHGPFRLVLDTGATRSALIPRVVEQLGLKPKPNGARVRGVTGTAVVPTVKVRSLEFGELRIDDATLPVVNDVFGGADGVLGGDGLRDKRIVIEFRKDRIDIARSRRQAAPGGFSVVPLDYVHARGLRARVMVGPVPTLAIIDTGGQATVGNLALHEALARRRGELDPFDDSIIGVTEDVQPAMRVRIPSIVAGELIVRRAEIRFADLHIFEHWNLTSQPALLIGMDVLGSLDTLILDYRREEMQVKTALGPAPARMPPADVGRAEAAFLEHLDAVGAAGFLESGGAAVYGGRDLAAWQARRASTRRALDGALSALARHTGQADAERRAVAAMQRTLAELDSGESTDAGPSAQCADAARRDLGEDELRAALSNCFVEHGNHLRYGDGEIDRGTALQLLHVVDDGAQRKAVFEAFRPLWHALDAGGGADSPYRRLIALTAARARREGSELDAAARALGVDALTVEHWLVQILEAWRDANPGPPIEPWDFRYLHGRANRELQRHIPASLLMPVNQRFHAELGADLDALRVVFDLEPRPGKSPLAYSDFLERGRIANGQWQRPRARVLGSYPEGGLFSLNELVHESGHAVHVSALRTRPAYMDWPDTLFVEAFADVTSWSVYEPAWQQKYLGHATDAAGSLRALLANVVLDVAWSLFELRMLRDPASDPNAVWTDITHRYLRVVPHPEVPWWAMRVQLVGHPGYMVNYGLGAVLTAELREHVADTIGDFDTGNPRWYSWVSERLLRFGSERDTRSLMHELLGRPVSPDALLRQLRRTASEDASAR